MGRLLTITIRVREKDIGDEYAVSLLLLQSNRCIFRNRDLLTNAAQEPRRL